MSRRAFLTGAALIVAYFCFESFTGVADALLLGFAGVLFAVMLDLPVSRLVRYMPRMPRVVAVLLVLALAAALLAVGLHLAVPVLGRQLGVLVAAVPAGLERILDWWNRSPAVPRTWAAPNVQLSSVLPAVAEKVVPVLSGTLAVVGGVTVVVTMGSFLCVDPGADRRVLEGLVPEPRREQLRARWDGVAWALRRWLAGSLVNMTLVGGLTALGLLIVGVPGWLGLGMITFFATIIPYLGSVVAGLAVVGAGLAESPGKALAGLVVFAVVQALQGSVIVPIVFKKAVNTPPAILLVTQIIFAASFGALGILLAQPLLAVGLVLLEPGVVEKPPEHSGA
jgi:predicted PurR-regulated permease PerM